MKKYIAAMLLVVPLFAFAHTDGTPHHEITADTGLLQEIQQQLNASITTQSTPDSSLVGKLKIRQAELIELAQQNPAAALRYVVPTTARSKQSVEAQKYIEQQGSISGTLEVIHVDDFDNPKNSYFTYVVSNGGVKTNVYTVKNISSRSGAKVSLQGYKLNATEFLTDAKYVTLGAAPDMGALGRQKMLVLLVNSTAQPEKPITPSELENSINNGQFQKFIKEASYGQTWFEAKAYGYITMPYSEKKEACGFAILRQKEVSDFLTKNNIRLSDYNRVLFAVPNYGSSCSSVGKNSEGYSVAWNRTDLRRGRGNQPFVWSEFDFLLAHELGHSLGLYHANGFDCGNSALNDNCTHIEYGNNYDAMGGGGEYSLHYNGFYKEILGWIKPESILNITQSGRYTIGHLEFATSSKKFAKVFNPAIPSKEPRFILESRYATGFDASISKFYPDKNSGIIVTKPAGNMTSSRLIDTTPSDQPWSIDTRDAGLKNQIFIDKSDGILMERVVTQIATSTTIDVRIDPPICIRRGMNKMEGYGNPISVSQGATLDMYVGFINLDSAFCGTSTFDFSIEIPQGWKSLGKPSSLEVKAGEETSANFQVSLPNDARLGSHTLNFYSLNRATGQKMLAGNVEVAVQTKVTVSSISPNPAKAGDTVTVMSKGHNLYAQEVDFYNRKGDFRVYEELHSEVTSDRIIFKLPTTINVERGDKEGVEPLPDGEYIVRVQGYGNGVDVPLYVGERVQPPTTATSTIKNVKAVTNTTPALLYKYENYPITWEGTNLSRVNIDLYDFKGLYKIETLEENYEVPFSKDNQQFRYNWYVAGFTLKDEIYTIKITDALNKKIKSTSSKIAIQNYQAPTIGSVQSVGTSTIKLISAPGGRESSLVGNFEIKINAVADLVSLPVKYGMYADAVRISPQDKPGEHSTKLTIAKIDNVTGDAILTKDAKGNDVYRILKGKSATFKISTTFKPEEMFAGQYTIELNYINVQNSQGKEGIVTFTPPKTPSVTIIGERAPYITSVNNPVQANLPVIIEGVRFSPSENILLAYGQQYKLKGAVNNKITFIPSEVGLAPGQYSFQLDSPQGKSNWEWLDIKEATNAANIFTAVWDLISGWFKSKPKQTTPAIETVTSVDTDLQRITVISPNGGEKIPFTEIFMAGDLGFRWKSETGPTASFYAAIINENGVLVRDTNRNSLSSLGGGLYASSFIGESKIEINKKYKIKVCDTISGYEVCDTSDDYFVIE